MAKTGAAIENTARCLRIRARSNPSCIKKDTRPNAAGAWNDKWPNDKDTRPNDKDTRPNDKDTRPNDRDTRPNDRDTNN